MTPDQGEVVTHPLGPLTVKGERSRHLLGWAGFASTSAAGAGCSAFVVWSDTLSAEVPFGLVAPAIFLGLSAVGLLIVIGIVAHVTKNDFGHFNLLAYLVVTVGWCILVWRVPHAIIHDPMFSSYSQLAPAGAWTVAVSMFSIMGALWVLGVQQILWRIRIPVVLGVFAAHVPLVVWPLGLPPA